MFDDFDGPLDEDRQLVLEHLDDILDSLGAPIGHPDNGAGACGECRRDVERRWTFGEFELCRECRRRRERARLALNPSLVEDLTVNLKGRAK